LPSYAFNRSGSPPGDHRSRLGGPCTIPIILLTLCECAPERLPCLVEYLKATQLFPRPYPRFTSYLYQVYETISPLVTSWYTIWAKVIVIVATYHRVVTPRTPLRVDSEFLSIDAPEMYLIPACSWRRAQRCPGDRIKIGYAVVEESAIEFRISRDKRPLSGGWAISMSINATGTYLIPA